MSLTVVSLASGSSGNALLVQSGSQLILVDCGITLRALEKLLAVRGLAPGDLTALLLTHEHGDHTYAAAALARRYRVPIVCNGPTAAALADETAGLAVELLPVGERASLGAFDVRSFRLAHDAAEPVGYQISAGDARLALAIDLGSWDAATAAALSGADLLVVEANHDRELLRAAPYPQAIRHRIFSPLGHLDNIQCGELLLRAGAGPQTDIWLAHLSEQANSPRIAAAGVRRVLALAGAGGPRISVLPRRSQAAPGGAPCWRSEDRLLRQHELFG